MYRFVLAASAALISLSPLTSFAASAQVGSSKSEIRFCVGSTGGNYAKVVAPRFAEQVGERFVVRVVPTKGSPEILERMALPTTDPNACDWGAAQLDAFALSTNTNDIQIETELYPEFLHFMCRKDVDVYSVKDLLNKPEKITVGTGSAFSGNEVAWRSLSKADKRFDQIPTQKLSIESKAAQDLGNGVMDCTIAVTGWKSRDMMSFINLLEDNGKSAVTLRPFWDDAFAKRTVTINGKSRQLYTKVKIPDGIYPVKFQPDKGWFSDASIETVSVPAVLLSRSGWMESQPEPIRDYLARAVINSRKVISKIMAQ